MDQARNSKKKKKIKMGKLLQFPVDRVKRPVPEIEITDEQKLPTDKKNIEIIIKSIIEKELRLIKTGL